ncbi:hypothetical protein GCM10009733_007870 [Nonomuraea maheshkhaliensis]|uniref:Uncharacterized protein n=1 Tax=Nonomuraea maheshkhaliensis TaxID=419590 RepID=A0ABN2EPX5_9ACTN
MNADAPTSTPQPPHELLTEGEKRPWGIDPTAPAAALAQAASLSPALAMPGEAPMAALMDVRTALAERGVSASIVFRNGSPRLLIAGASPLARWEEGSFTWGQEDVSPPSGSPRPDRPSRHINAHDCAAAVVTAVVSAVTTSPARLADEPARQRALVASAGDNDPVAGVYEPAGPATASTALPAARWHPELQHACEALAKGALMFHDLSVELASPAERTSPAHRAGQALATALDAHKDVGSVAIPINPWVSAVWACQGLIVLTDGACFVWPQMTEHGGQLRWRVVHDLQRAVQGARHERAKRFRRPLA